MLTSTIDFSGQNFSNLERLALLITSLDLFLDNPLGHGLGSTSALFENAVLTAGTYPHPHNTLAMYAVEFGVIGILLYTILIVALAKAFLTGSRMLRKDPSGARFLISMSVAVALITLYEAIFFNGFLAMNMFIALGMLIAAREIVQSSTPIEEEPLGISSAQAV